MSGRLQVDKRALPVPSTQPRQYPRHCQIGLAIEEFAFSTATTKAVPAGVLLAAPNASQALRPPAQMHYVPAAFAVAD